MKPVKFPEACSVFLPTHFFKLGGRLQIQALQNESPMPKIFITLSALSKDQGN